MESPEISTVNPNIRFYWLAFNHESGQYPVNAYEIVDGLPVFLYTSAIKDTQARARKAVQALNQRYNRNWPLCDTITDLMEMIGFYLSDTGYVRDNLRACWDSNARIFTVTKLQSPKAPIAVLPYNIFFIPAIAKLLKLTSENS